MSAMIGTQHPHWGRTSRITAILPFTMAALLILEGVIVWLDFKDTDDLLGFTLNDALFALLIPAMVLGVCGGMLWYIGKKCDELEQQQVTLHRKVEHLEHEKVEMKATVSQLEQEKNDLERELDAVRDRIVARYQLRIEHERVFRGDEELRLPPLEFQLLKYLMENENNVCDHADLIKVIWKDEQYGTRTRNDLNTLIKRLRDRLQIRAYIRAVEGRGYTFVQWPG
jgi:cell division protein FtsB